MNSRPSARLRAFTLIELLTVIAIIGILAAILIPVVGKVRDSAHAAKTRSNLRQLYVANRLHSQDFKGFFVPGKTNNNITWNSNSWFLSYLSQEKHNEYNNVMPEPLVRSGKPNANGGRGLSIGLNIGQSTVNQVQVFKASDVDSAFSGMIMFADAGEMMISGARLAQSPDHWPDEGLAFGHTAFRHGGKANMVLANGGVKALSKAEVTAAASTFFPVAAANPGAGQLRFYNPNLVPY